MNIKLGDYVTFGGTVIGTKNNEDGELTHVLVDTLSITNPDYDNYCEDYVLLNIHSVKAWRPKESDVMLVNEERLNYIQNVKKEESS